MRRERCVNGCGLVFVCVVLAAVGCAEVATQTPAPILPPTPAPPAVAEPALAEPTLDPREERRLTKDLREAVAEYYRLLRGKDVEQAAAYAAPEARQRLQDDLWGYVARYRIESADVASQELSFQGPLAVAKVKVVLTIFERSSVTPQRTQEWMTWEYRQNRWVFVPQTRR